LHTLTSTLFPYTTLFRSIYVHSNERNLLKWYVDRFISLQHTAFQKPDSYFHKFANLGASETIKTATGIWNEINKPNLLKNILPTDRKSTRLNSSHVKISY